MIGQTIRMLVIFFALAVACGSGFASSLLGTAATSWVENGHLWAGICDHWTFSCYQGPTTAAQCTVTISMFTTNTTRPGIFGQTVLTWDGNDETTDPAFSRLEHVGKTLRVNHVYFSEHTIDFVYVENTHFYQCWVEFKKNIAVKFKCDTNSNGDHNTFDLIEGKSCP